MGMFFTSWALWEEMTFVLALSIAIVFCLGLFKLWWTTRSVRKQEILDEEKRARLTEMRKTGLSPQKSPKKRGDIPFGVRALQSGVEVEGIWISRPNTPSRSSSKSKLALSTATIYEIDEDGKTRAKHVPDDQRSHPSRPTPYRTPSGLSVHESQGGGDIHDGHSPRSLHLPQISENSAFLNHNRHAGRLNEEALRRLEGQTAQRAPQLTTYIPRSPLLSPNPSLLRNYYYRPSQRSSASSETMSSTSSRNPSTSSTQRSFSERAAADGKPSYTAAAPGSPKQQPYTREASQGSPVRFSTATASTFLTGSSFDSRVPLVAPQPIPAPAPTFGPGDTYANRVARKINAGFEVLPAGTFGSPQDLSPTLSGDSREDEDDKISRNKLRRKTNQMSAQ